MSTFTGGFVCASLRVSLSLCSCSFHSTAGCKKITFFWRFLHGISWFKFDVPTCQIWLIFSFFLVGFWWTFY